MLLCSCQTSSSSLLHRGKMIEKSISYRVAQALHDVRGGCRQSESSVLVAASNQYRMGPRRADLPLFGRKLGCSLFAFYKATFAHVKNSLHSLHSFHVYQCVMRIICVLSQDLVTKESLKTLATSDASTDLWLQWTLYRLALAILVPQPEGCPKGGQTNKITSDIAHC